MHGTCEVVVTDFRPIPLHWNFCYSGDGQTSMVPFFASDRKLNPVLGEDNYSTREASEREGKGLNRRARR